ncbi:MAG: cyclic nucleotide-binding/CBS domain-containing protein [Rhodospirillaceae bacterium]
MPKRKIHEVMSDRDIVKIGPDQTVREAAQSIKDNHVGSVLVEERGRLLGILTERDIIERVLCRDLSPDQTLVRDVMTRNPRTVRSDATVFQALQAMKEGGVRHLPVFREDQVVSVVSMRDFVPVEVRMFDRAEEVCEELMQRIA